MPARLLPTSPSHTTYQGFITVPSLAGVCGGDSGSTGSGDAWVRIEGVDACKTKRGGGGGGRGPPPAPLARARLHLGPELDDLLKPHAHTLASRLREAATLPAFLVELAALADRAVADACPPAPPPPPASLTAAAIAALEAAGGAAWAALTASSPCGTRLTFEGTDASGRTHSLHVRIEPGFPARPPRLTADLPAAVVRGMLASGSAPHARGPLAAALAAWHAALAACADLWACLDALDAAARILDPAPPRRADVHRVVALCGGGSGGAGAASLEIELDPARPRAPPTSTAFLGAPASVAGPRAALASFLEGGRWDEAALPSVNLAAALAGAGGLQPAAAVVAAGGAPIAAAVTTDADEPTGAECAICYAYHLPPAAAEEEGGGGAAAPPAVHCPHPQCGRPYHAACLRGWLASLPGARTALGRLAGDCPYCGETIGVDA